MSEFNPVVPPIPRPTDEQLLARFVPSALRRVPPTAKIWSVVKTFVVGFATAGLLPFLALGTRIGQTMSLHARQCERAADLLCPRLPADDAEVLRDAADGVNVRRTWAVVGTALWSVGAVTFFVWAWQQPSAVRAVWPLAGRRTIPADIAGVFGTAALSLAYLAFVAQINTQLVAMQQFALAFNAIYDERVRVIDLPPLVWGLKAWHVLAGLTGAWLGPVWLLPMMLAWAAHTAFARDAAYRFRVQLAERITTLTGVEPVVPTQDVCANPDCRHSMMGDARFCPRCGTPKNR